MAVKSIGREDIVSFVSVPEPAQARSQDALNRMLAVGEQLLAENAYEEASVAHIASRATSSVGTFYRVLTDKDTLSQLLLQRFFLRLIDTVDDLTQVQQWHAKSLTAFVEALVSYFVSTYSGRRGVLRALILRASKDANFRDRVHLLNEYIALQVVNVIQSHHQEVHHPKPEKAMQAAVHILLGALNQHTLTGNLGHLTEQELEQELAKLFIDYLEIHL